VDQTCQVKPECAADMYQIDVEMRRDVNASNHSSDLPETADFFRCWCSRAGRAPCGRVSWGRHREEATGTCGEVESVLGL